MTAAWPATLPQFVQEQGFSEKLPDNRIETQVDGATKSRRRYTTQRRPLQFQIWCDADQAEDFEDFYHDDLKDGVLPFTWVDPRTQAAATFKFRGGPPAVDMQGEIHVYTLTVWRIA